MHPTGEIEKFGDYYLLKEIASGAFTDVFIAIPQKIKKRGNLCIVKRVKREFSENKRFITMLIDEAKISSLFSFPNICEIYDFGYVRNDFFISMEYIEGQNLASLISSLNRKKTKIEPLLAIHIMVEVLNGLEYAHNFADGEGRKFKIVHRDISPQNIMLSHNGEVKLMDFGLAIPEKRLLANSSLLIGKLPYMPPEAITLSAYDNRYDIYSCGILLYEMLNGAPPYRGSSQLELRDKILKELPRIIPDQSEEVNDIVFKSISKNPSSRFLSALDFRSSLLKLCGDYNRKMGKEQIAILVNTIFQKELDMLKEEISQKISTLSDTISFISERDAPPNKPPDFHSEETLLADDLSGQNKDAPIGATEVLFGKSEDVALPAIGIEKKKCQYHPIEFLSLICKNCGREICSLCIKNAKGKPLCPLCCVIMNKKKEKRERVIKITRYILILFSIVLAVILGIAGLKYFNHRPLSFIGIQPQRIALVEFVEPDVDVNDPFIKILNGENPSYESKSIINISKYFESEYERYSGIRREILTITPIGPFKLKEEITNPSDFFSKLLFKNLLEKLSFVNRIKLTGYDGTIFVFIQSKRKEAHTPDAMSRFLLFTPLSFIFLNGGENSLLLITHEIAKIAGASVKYNKRGAIYPAGFAAPFQSPLYPQNSGEIMALSIPLTENNFKQSNSLFDFTIGPETAFELGWISKTNRDRYYKK